MSSSVYNSPLGEIFLESDGESLTGLRFKDSQDEKERLPQADFVSLPVFEQTRKWLDIYFSGNEPDFIPPYKLSNLSPFREKVYKILAQIPYGTTMTYDSIAKKVAMESGKAKMSAQAVGGAVGANSICIIVPCHRVMGVNGTLVGFSGGIKNKIKLLEREHIDIAKFYFKSKSKQKGTNSNIS